MLLEERVTKVQCKIFLGSCSWIETSWFCPGKTAWVTAHSVNTGGQSREGAPVFWLSETLSRPPLLGNLATVVSGLITGSRNPCSDPMELDVTPLHKGQRKAPTPIMILTPEP